MPMPETLESFIAMVERNAHAEACEAFYTERSTMQENQSPPRIGRDAHVAGEHKVMARARSVRSQCVRPVLVNGDHVVIHDPHGRARLAALGGRAHRRRNLLL